MIVRIESRLAEMQVGKMDFYDECGFSPSNFILWKTGKTAPRQRTIDKMARFLGTSSRYLMYGDGEKNTAPENGGGSDEEWELIDLIGQLTDAEKTILIAQIKGILNNR